LDQGKQDHEDSLPFYDLADCMTYTPNHLCTDTWSVPNISAHDGVEEENLTEDDDASQAENSQPYNKAVQSITTDKEDKDIEAKGFSCCLVLTSFYLYCFLVDHVISQ
jgi:hypothetical protein